MALAHKENMAAFAVGRRVNMEEWNSITRTKGDADSDTGAPLPFGVPVIPGVTERTCKAMTNSGGENVLGITEASQTLPHTGDAYLQYDNVVICESGVIGVKLGTDVTEGAKANFDTANGVWVVTAKSATIIEVPGAQFNQAGKSGEVGAVRYRRPVPSLSVKG